MSLFSPALALHLSLSVLCVRSFVFVPSGSPQAPQSAGRLIIKLACACAEVPLTRTSSLGAICREGTAQSHRHRKVLTALEGPILTLSCPPGKRASSQELQLATGAASRGGLWV